MKFNEQQNKIINSLKGAYLVSAPVGTGKTTVLTERVLKALESGFKPEEILCLTFTNRAAEEMIERIRTKVRDKQVFDNLLISTFHGFCAYFIRAEAKAIGINADFVIFDEDEQIEVMKKVLENYPGLLEEEGNKKQQLRNLIEKVYKRRQNKLMREIGCDIEAFADDKILDAIGKDYQEALNLQNALDFNELVLLAMEGIYQNESLRKKWSRRFKFIQLDEFQDTHLSEYLVVKELAKKHKNISLIGDLDQTIYSWRGSEPELVARVFKSHFNPVKELHLEVNYRFNTHILEAIKSFLSSFARPNTKTIKAEKAGLGDKKCIELFGAYNPVEEISYAADRIKMIKEQHPKAKIAVLARANYMLTQAALVFKEKGLEHITVDKYDFSRRQEVKDALAYLKILFNKYDLESAYRIVNRPARNIGPTTLKKIRLDGAKAGLRISDLLDFNNFVFSEPFENIIKKHKKGRLVVFDTETTGTNPLKDEIIQIYAIEVVDGKPGNDFHFYLKNSLPVGNSELVHGISDEYLKDKGRYPQTVLRDFKDFIANDIAIGHNVNFDISMTVENGKRHGIDFEFKEHYDTLDLARRLVESENYRLNTLAQKFGLETATHDARDDVMATVGLLAVLVEMLDKGSAGRTEIFSGFKPKFIGLASDIAKWKKEVEVLRPNEALRYIWKESGLMDHYAQSKEAKTRQSSIDTLTKIFARRDDNSLPGTIALRGLINFAALTRDINFLGLEKGKVPVVTVHQVKGLEFDHVFIIGLNEGKFPIMRRDSDLEEERRLFYVALTRARERIYLFYSRHDDYGRNLAMSSFIPAVAEEYIYKVN